MGDNKHNNCSGSQVKWGSSLHSRTRLVNHASALSNPSDQTPTIRFEPRIVVQYFRGKRKASSIYRESEIAQKITATSKNSTAQINYVQLVKIQVELADFRHCPGAVWRRRIGRHGRAASPVTTRTAGPRPFCRRRRYCRRRRGCGRA
jgi:hypothetical protein